MPPRKGTNLDARQLCYITSRGLGWTWPPRLVQPICQAWERISWTKGKWSNKRGWVTVFSTSLECFIKFNHTWQDSHDVTDTVSSYHREGENLAWRALWLQEITKYRLIIRFLGGFFWPCGIIYFADMFAHILHNRHKRHNCISSALFVMAALILCCCPFHVELGGKKNPKSTIVVP